MSKRHRRTGRKLSKRFPISDAILYGLTRGLTRDRHEVPHRDAAPERNETHDTGDILDLATIKRGFCVLVRAACKLFERIKSRGR